MIAALAGTLVPLLAALGCHQATGEPYHRLVRSPEALIWRVFSDQHGDGAQYHVLTRDGLLGSFEVGAEGVAAVETPRVRLPHDLDQNQTWILSPGGTTLGLSEAFVEDLATRTEYFTFPRRDETVNISRPDYCGVTVSDDGSTVVFVHASEDGRSPVRIEVLESDGRERFEPLDRDSLGRVRFSASGRSLAVQTGARIEIFEDQQLAGTEAGDKELRFEPAGSWLLIERPAHVEAFDPTDSSDRFVLPTQGAVVFIAMVGNHALLGGHNGAVLHDLTDATRSVSFVPEPGFRFVSGALRPREGSRPWVALGQLQVAMPAMHFPGSAELVGGQDELPEPLARARVTIHAGSAERIGEPWDFELHDWRGDCPELHWTRAGRLLASFPELAVISRETF